MTTTKLLNGAWEVCSIIGGYLVRRAYYGYSKREAIRLFRAEVVNNHKRGAE